MTGLALGRLKFPEGYGAVLVNLYEERISCLDVEGFGDLSGYPDVEGCVPASSSDLPDDNSVLDGRGLHLLCSCVVGKLMGVIRVVRYIRFFVRVVR